MGIYLRWGGGEMTKNKLINILNSIFDLDKCDGEKYHRERNKKSGGQTMSLYFLNIKLDSIPQTRFKSVRAIRKTFYQMEYQKKCCTPFYV